MKISSKALFSGLLSLLLISTSLAANKKVSAIAPQPTSCVTSSFSSTGDNYWRTITLTLINECGKPVDLQNATITFKNRSDLNTHAWVGDYYPLSYPDKEIFITSQKMDTYYLSTFTLHFPQDPWANSKLPPTDTQKKIRLQILYGAIKDDHIGYAQVYLNDVTTPKGSIALNNSSAQPSGVQQPYAVVHVLANNINVTNVQLPWNGSQTVSGLAAGNYSITADSISGNGTTYQGVANPATVSVVADGTVNSTISYSAVSENAKLAIQLQNLPGELSGYTGKPVATLTQSGSGSSVTANLDWGTTTTVSSLQNGSSYTFSTPVISYNNYTCKPTFNPASAVASTSSTVPTSNLTYVCSQVAQSSVTLNVTGAPSTLDSLNVTLTPNNGAAAITQNIPLSNGQGSKTVSLTTGTIYNITADNVSGYTINFNPQPLTAANGATETITLSAQPTGTPVAMHGKLSVCGTKICDEHGQVTQLKGMSSHGIQWYGWQGSNTQKACLTTASLDTLTKVWKASVIRISMYVQEGGYETNPQGFTNQVKALIDEATKRGIYAIVDWHILNPGDPNVNLDKAKTFFSEIARTYKDNNNVLYEIANEPNNVPWSSIKSYAENLIPVIRAIDSDAIILVGTPGWSSLGLSDGRSSQDIINAPLNFTNIMYTFHFYAASHGANYKDEVDRASNVLPIFVTEFGEQTFSGDGENNFDMTDQYLDLFARKSISWTNWNYSDDWLSGAKWKPGTCPNGAWTDSNLKPSGVYIKSKIMS